jgi:hypothetical protein
MSSFSQESFSGFDMTDSELAEGPYRHVAIELKHAFEGMARDADENNEECFLAADVKHALRRLMSDPIQASLDNLLEVSPALIEPVATILNLVTPGMFNEPAPDSDKGDLINTSVLQGCDLQRAALELLGVLAVGKEQDARNGGTSYFPPDLHRAMTLFLASPTLENAAALIEVAPSFRPLFRT